MAILIEVIEFFSDLPSTRRAAATVMDGILRREFEGRGVVGMIGLDTRDFLEAFVLFQARAELSFTECLTLVQCKKAGIESILSHNKHFASEGLNLLF